MRQILKYLLKTYLKLNAKIILAYHKPIIIAVAGSLNKTFFKDSIYNEISGLGWSSKKTINNFNTEIGLSLSILGLNSGYNSYKKWAWIITEIPKKIFNSQKNNILVLEFGTSEPGDMEYLMSITKPDITIITEISKRYLESFGTIDALINEFKILIKNTKSNGLVVLNYDNKKVLNLRDFSHARVETFGLTNKADYFAKSFEQFNSKLEIVGENRLKIVKNIVINRHGIHHIYASLASWIIGDFLGKKNEKE